MKLTDVNAFSWWEDLHGVIEVVCIVNAGSALAQLSRVN
jgi:hypothetical protein